MSVSRNYLFSLEQIGIKLGLDQIRTLVGLLDHPDRAFPSLIIAGTNGKGSVTAMVERGLRSAGYRTGRYTSPHLLHLEERFAVNGTPLTPAEVDRAAARIERAALEMDAPPSFFEATTAMALDLFREARVDVAVLEVGLGGRLDATNVVDAPAVAITAIDFDHEQYLGDTIEAIAGEKAGVIKPGSVAVLGRNPEAVRAVVGRAAANVNASLVYAPDDTTVEARLVDGRTEMLLRTPRTLYEVLLSLRGRHQVDNALTAVRLLETLDARQLFVVPERAVREALETAVWPARLEHILWRGRSVIVDGAHNPAGARALAAYVLETYGRALPFVVGVMRDKRVDEILPAMAPAASAFICTAANSPRATPPDTLAAQAIQSAPSVPAHAVSNPLEALQLALDLGVPAVVAGSLYLCGEIRGEIT